MTPFRVSARLFLVYGLCYPVMDLDDRGRANVNKYDGLQPYNHKACKGKMFDSIFLIFMLVQYLIPFLLNIGQNQ